MCVAECLVSFFFIMAALPSVQVGGTAVFTAPTHACGSGGWLGAAACSGAG